MKKTLSLLLVIMFIVATLFAKNNQDKSLQPKQIKKVMSKAAMWQLANPKHELYDWTNGAFYAGISAAYQSTSDKRYLNAMTEMGEKKTSGSQDLAYNMLTIMLFAKHI